MKKRVVCLLLLLMVVLLLSACVADRGRTQYLYDYNGLFEAQYDDINDACAQATKRYHVTFLVATCLREGTRATLNGEQLLRQLGLSDEDDYVVIIVNARGYGDDYHFDIYTYGSAVRRLSDDDIDEAVYSIYADRILTSSSATAASGICEMLPMLGKGYDNIPLWLNIVIGVALGLLISGIIVRNIRRGYGLRRKNETYPLDKYCTMSLTGRDDTYLRSHTTVTVIDSGNGGRGGGGHISGGGGGGGGGGHRGGR